MPHYQSKNSGGVHELHTKCIRSKQTILGGVIVRTQGHPRPLAILPPALAGIEDREGRDAEALRQGGVTNARPDGTAQHGRCPQI
jgi:hypothetical protein